MDSVIERVTKAAKAIENDAKLSRESYIQAYRDDDVVTVKL